MFDKTLFASRLAALRKDKNLTQADLGKIIGMSKQGVNEIEKERSSIKDEKLYLLAECFNVSTDYLLGFTDKCELRDSYPPTEPELECLRLFRSLSADDQQRILETMKVWKPLHKESAREKGSQTENQGKDVSNDKSLSDHDRDRKIAEKFAAQLQEQEDGSAHK